MSGRDHKRAQAPLAATKPWHVGAGTDAAPMMRAPGLGETPARWSATFALPEGATGRRGKPPQTPPEQ